MNYLSYSLLTSSAVLGIIAAWFFVQHRLVSGKLASALDKNALVERELTLTKAQLAQAVKAANESHERAVEYYEYAKKQAESITSGPGATADAVRKLREAIGFAINNRPAADAVPAPGTTKPKG